MTVDPLTRYVHITYGVPRECAGRGRRRLRLVAGGRERLAAGEGHAAPLRDRA